MSEHLKAILTHAEDKAAEAGSTFEVGTNPILEATAKALEAQTQIRGLLEHEETELEKHQRFTQAAAPFLGCKPPKDLRQRMRAARPLTATAGPVAPLPSKFDLRDLGLVTPPRNQLSCGSCWDFSGVKSVESAALGTGKFKADELDLSEQEVLSCGKNGGCDGDWPETAFEFAKTRGLPSEKEVPYRANSGSGRCYTGQPLVKIDGYAYVASADALPTADEIKRSLYERRVALSVGVAVDAAWMAYRSGIFNGQIRDPDMINHAVNYIAWDDQPDGSTVFVVENQWGTDWGEGGYMRTRHGANLIGYGAQYCWINGNPTPVPPTPPTPVPPSPPVPPVPPTPQPQVMNITLSGSFPTLFGGHQTVTLTGKGVFQVSGNATDGDCHGCNDRMPLGWSFAQWRQLLADVYTLIQSDPAQQVETAVLTIYGDIRAGKYGEAVAVALSSMAAVQALIQAVQALVQKYRSTSHGLQGSFFDWLGAHQAELIQLALFIWRATHGG